MRHSGWLQPKGWLDWHRSCCTGRMYRFIFSVVICLSLPAPLLADQAQSAPDCEALAEQAARTEAVPPGILSAIARVESGRSLGSRFAAWPWTLNQAGNGAFFPDKSSAMRALKAHLAAGHRNIDIGCMQINWRWHAESFADLSLMMDPQHNTRYAARYLRELYARFGSWQKAIMNYHSRDPKHGKRYAQRVADQMGLADLAQLHPSDMPDAPRIPRQSGVLLGANGAVIDMSHRRATLFP